MASIYMGLDRDKDISHMEKQQNRSYKKFFVKHTKLVKHVACKESALMWNNFHKTPSFAICEVFVTVSKNLYTLLV